MSSGGVGKINGKKRNWRVKWTAVKLKGSLILCRKLTQTKLTRIS